MVEKQTRLYQFLWCYTAQMAVAAVVALEAPNFPAALKEEIATLDCWQSAMNAVLKNHCQGLLVHADKVQKAYSEYILHPLPKGVKENVTTEEVMHYWLHALFLVELMLLHCVHGCPMFASGIVWKKAKDLIRTMAKRYAPPEEDQTPEEVMAWKTYMHFVKAIKSEVANRKRKKP